MAHPAALNSFDVTRSALMPDRGLALAPPAVVRPAASALTSPVEVMDIDGVTSVGAPVPDGVLGALDELAASARTLLGAEGACVVTLDDGSTGGRIDATAGTFAPMRGQHTEILAPPSPLRRAIDERRVVMTNGGAVAHRDARALGTGLRHVIVAPLIVDDSVVAVLCAINSMRGGFSDDDGETAARLAHDGARALRTCRLQHTIDRGAHDARILGDAARVVAGSASGASVFAELARVARESLGTCGFVALRADPASGRVERLYGEDGGEMIVGATDVTAFWNSAGGRAVRDVLPAFVNGVVADRPTVVDRAMGRTLDANGVRAFVLIPWGADDARGLLTLRFAERRTFDEEERALFTAFTAHVASAAHIAAADASRHRERARADAASALARAALDADDLVAGATAVLAVVDALLPSLGKALCVQRLGERIAECVAATGTATKLRGLRVPCAEATITASGDAAPILIPDLRARLGAAFRGRAPAESAVLLPLAVRGRSIGDVSVMTPLGASLAGDDLATLCALGPSIALAVETLVLGEASRRRDTEERRIDEQLRQTEKMAALGELVAGVAHEINNPLTGISAFAELLLEDSLTEDQRESARLIKREADRAVNVVRDLLAFSRKTEPTYGPVDLNDLLERTLRLRAYALRSASVDVDISLGVDLPLAHGDEAKLQQVVLNLLLNAEYALREAPVRRLTASTRLERDRLILAVSDTGSGIPSDVLPRIFEPFFTTKPAGDGTGLGLSVSYGIVQAHGGELRARSSPRAGTTFEVVLRALLSPSKT